MIITIDGPAGTGKSTVAHRLAKRLGLEFLDTGAMYRALTLSVIEVGADPADGKRVAAIVEGARVLVDFHHDPPSVRLDGRDVNEAIRGPAVTAAVSAVASHPEVRVAMVRAQREIAQAHPQLVTEGRDQGSFVFPDADVKFYLDASVEIRASRRAEQLRQRGERVDLAELREAIEARDRSDRSRSMGALTCPVDALRVDTGPMSVSEVVEHLAALAEARGRASAGGALRMVREVAGTEGHVRFHHVEPLADGVSA